ncbi:MAG: histidinol-phosphatase [Nitrospiria bacterium]
MSPPERNRQVAHALIRMAQVLEAQGDNPYRARAYRRGAGSVWAYPAPIEGLAAQGRLESLAGIGADLASKIVEILDTGTFAAYEQQLRQADPEVRQLIAGGFSPDLALLIDAYRRRDALDELRALADSRLLRSMPGVTKADETLIVEWIDRRRVSSAEPAP